MDSVLGFLSSMMGWGYTAAWSLSFYPQPLLNYSRKSTLGTTIDFPFINSLGMSPPFPPFPFPFLTVSPTSPGPVLPALSVPNLHPPSKDAKAERRRRGKKLKREQASSHTSSRTGPSTTPP